MKETDYFRGYFSVLGDTDIFNFRWCRTQSTVHITFSLLHVGLITSIFILSIKTVLSTNST